LSLSNLANRLGAVGRREEALETSAGAVALYRRLVEASPAAYLPDLAISLSNLAVFLSEAGQTEQAEEQFADIVGAFPGSTRGIGHLLLARGRWRAGQARLADALPDLAAAASTSDRDDDRLTRGQARLALRTLRENDERAFDQAWGEANGPLPVWLVHLTDPQQLTEKIIAWIGTPDWQASHTYLDDNAADLLTDEAEAATEHLIDINPAADSLLEHLELLKAARAHGADAAYAAHQEQLLASRLAQTLGQWLATPTWTASRAFAADRSDDLLHPATQALLDSLGSQDPADPDLRLHRGLLAYAATAGFDAAYDLLPDTGRQHAITADPATPADTGLAIARMRSAQGADDPEAHFQLAVITLLAIPDHGAPEAADPFAREAAAALADCAANAAPYEQRDYARRLSQLCAERPALAPYEAELQHALTGKPDASPG
jgi:tetratricopeptide (TPR) repeat protein